jgi:hypothetical protein
MMQLVSGWGGEGGGQPTGYIVATRFEITDCERCNLLSTLEGNAFLMR